MKPLRKVIGAALAAPLLALVLGVWGGGGSTTTLADGVHPGITPALVDDIIAPGDSLDIEKTVHTPELPPLVDVCLLEDETGSFIDDIGNLQGGTTASDIYDTVTTASPGANFAVAGFRDYPQSPYGLAGDWVYRLLSSMSPAKADWLNGIAGLTAVSGAGNDTPEAQYDAIVAAAGPGTFSDPTLGTQDNCGWRADPNVTRVLVVTTDAPFHTPDGTHVNDHASTVAALDAQGIAVVGLKAPGAGPELDNLVGALAAGGSVQPLSSDGSDIGDAIVAGLSNLPIEVEMVSDCSDPISVSFAPASQVVTSGEHAVFTETISVADDATQDMTYECDDWALIDGAPMADETGEIITEHKRIFVPDVVPPEPACTETVNPHGSTVPPAGSTTLPGPKGGQNEDGFYELTATDNVDPNPEIFVMDTGSGTVFGPFTSGDKIKYTEDPDATPESKKIGSTKGQAGAVGWHIIGTGDAAVFAVDASGNQSDPVACLVPPPPK